MRRLSLIARWVAVIAVIVLAVGCSDNDKAASPSPSTTTVLTTTTAPTPTTVPTSFGPGPTATELPCQDAPPPPEPYFGPGFDDSALGGCFHFWGVVEQTERFPYEGTDFGCTVDLLVGTTPPMIAEPRSVHIGSGTTSECRVVTSATVGDPVEVWASLLALQGGTGLVFVGFRLTGQE